MKNCRTYIQNLRKQLRIILTSKRLVIFVSVISMFGTVFFVRFLKTTANKNNNELDIFYEEALKGKKAVSVTVDINDIPLEFIYPGVKVDVVDIGNDPVKYLVRGVYVIAVSIVDSGNKVKADLAVSNEQSEIILNNRNTKINLLARGHQNQSGDDIEIIELN